MEAETVAPQDEYRPRRARFARLVQAGPATIKLSTISVSDAHVDEDAVNIAAAFLGLQGAMIAATDHRNAGFAVLHHGEEAWWLLLHWWLEGGIATQKLWRADLASGGAFAPADPLLMACVWELSVIDFERRAWMRTAMAGRPVSVYLDDKFPEGTA
ncbi:hypothetical protein [Limoniibacter endophyticus]|uniref:hypothetical protein n=1 Tax=Limoniibacter endophyticus TaxID=1565040 RepID=UPI001AEDCBAB|nr:hypothetical protein [Limoniibacter endophyticus]